MVLENNYNFRMENQDVYAVVACEKGSILFWGENAENGNENIKTKLQKCQSFLIYNFSLDIVVILR